MKQIETIGPVRIYRAPPPDEAPRSLAARACFVMAAMLIVPPALHIYPLFAELYGEAVAAGCAVALPAVLGLLLALSPRVQGWQSATRRRYGWAVFHTFILLALAHGCGWEEGVFGHLWTLCFLPMYGSLLFTLGSAFLPKEARA